MKLALISDIHGNLSALDAVLADIAQIGVDMVLNLGDILSGALLPCETADRLIPLDFPTIKGNHERQLLTHDPEKLGPSDRHALTALRQDQWNWLRSLPSELTIANDVLMVHGIPGDDLRYFLEIVTDNGVSRSPAQIIEKYAEGITQSLIVCGHTHLPGKFVLNDGRLVVNPGSVGLQAYEDKHPYYHRMQSGSPHARYAIVEGTRFKWEVVFRRVEYDWHNAAKIAAQNGRADWVVPLEQGIV